MPKKTKTKASTKKTTKKTSKVDREKLDTEMERRINEMTIRSLEKKAKNRRTYKDKKTDDYFDQKKGKKPKRGPGYKKGGLVKGKKK